MKKIILIILIMQGILCPVMAYQSSVYGSSRVAETEYRRIGYTTNYASGNFSTSAYNRWVSTTTGYYGGTYTTASGSGTGRPSGAGPKKVKGYDSDGNKIGDDSPETGTGIGRGESFWQDEYEYYWDGNSWYRYKDGVYEKWMSFLGWHWQWFGSSTKPSGAEPGYQENPTPIGEPVIPSVLLAVGYFAYKAKTRRFEVVREE